jgi:GH43 family beta-xylosidase
VAKISATRVSDISRRTRLRDGHNSFFKSPDGTEDWILYHANSEPGQGCGRHRSPRAQKFTWKPDDTPDFGEPLPINTRLPRPSGEQ